MKKAGDLRVRAKRREQPGKPPKAAKPRPAPVAPPADARHPLLRIPDLIAIFIIVLIAAAAAVVSMMESYTNLLDFALNHELHGWRADIAPGAVDSFIVIGELLLFVAVYRAWNQWKETGWWRVPSMVVYGWALAVFGFTLSVLGNLGHLHTTDPATRLMSGVFPVSATVAMAAVLMILKRVVQDHRDKITALADIRPHGELMYLLGGFPAPKPPAIEEPARPRRKRQPAVTAPETPALPATPTAETAPDWAAPPRMVPDPDPRPGQVSRPIEITSEVWAKLSGGITAERLAAEHPELGSRFRVGQVHKAFHEGRLASGEDVDGLTVVMAQEAASGE